MLDKDFKLVIRYFLQAFSVILIGLILISSAFNLYKYGKEMFKYTNLRNFKYIIANEQNVNIIDDYIIKKEAEGKTIYILDARAALYMIPLDKYNKDFDMFMKGNFGAKR